MSTYKRRTPAGETVGARLNFDSGNDFKRQNVEIGLRKGKSEKVLPHVVICCDGACTRNPGGSGGFGAILRCDNRYREVSGFIPSTTNNRAELEAVIAALSVLKVPCKVTIRTDSRVAIQGIGRGLRYIAGTRVKAPANRDLVELALKAMEPHEVTFEWVRGHAGDPDNERADQLAVAAARIGRAA